MSDEQPKYSVGKVFTHKLGFDFCVAAVGKLQDDKGKELDEWYYTVIWLDANKQLQTVKLSESQVQLMATVKDA